MFVGDGLLVDQLRQQVNRAGLGGHVRLLGLVGPERIPGLMAAMDILVHTSLREGLARVLPQALITGTAGRELRYRRCARSGDSRRNRLSRAPQRRRGHRGGARTLTCDAGLRYRLGAEGRRRFADQFRHETMTRRLRELYLEILVQKGHVCGTP